MRVTIAVLGALLETRRNVYSVMAKRKFRMKKLVFGHLKIISVSLRPSLEMQS